MQDLDTDRHDLIAALIKRAGPRTQPSVLLEARVRAATHAEWQRLLRRERLRRTAGWLAAATVAGVAITIGWKAMAPASQSITVATIVYGQGSVRINDGALSETASAAAVIRSGDNLSTGSGRGARVEFANGGSLRLAANTRLHWSNEKEVELLGGSIYVDSGPQHAALTIATKYGVVSHVGTRYRVKLASDAIIVGVRDGRVEVAGVTGRVAAESAQEFRLDKDGRVTRTYLAPFGDEWTWVDTLAPRFDIENRSLQDFLYWSANETGRTLEYADAPTENAAAATTLHGSSGTFGPQEATGAIVPTTDFVVRYDGKRMIVSRR